MARFDELGNRPAGSIPSEHPLVGAADAALAAIGRKPKHTASSTDANAALRPPGCPQSPSALLPDQVSTPRTSGSRPNRSVQVWQPWRIRLSGTTSWQDRHMQTGVALQGRNHPAVFEEMVSGGGRSETTTTCG